jgi:hypothetical protein
MVLKVLAAVSATLLSFALPAAALTLECRVDAGAAGGGYITDSYVFQYDVATGKALASDGWILHYYDAPIPAKVADDTAKKLVLTWTVQMTNSTGQQTKMLYRASYFKQSRQITVRAVPGGYRNSFEGRGKCKTL